MHKVFYASGFLYHPATEQILLQQSVDASTDSSWSLFCAETDETISETPLITLINSFLKTKISPKTIRPIYQYNHKDQNEEYAISYIELEKMQDFSPQKGKTFTWFTRKQIQKLPLEKQLRQDLTIGLRVIDAQRRKILGEPSREE